MTAVISFDTVQAAAFFPGNFDFLVTASLEMEVAHVFPSSFCTSQNTTVSEFCPSGIFSWTGTVAERKLFHLLQEGVLGQFSLHIRSVSP